MSRAANARSEGPSPDRRPPSRPVPLETLLALGLCAAVLVASLAFLRNSRALSRTMAELQSVRPPATSARQERNLASADSRPALVVLISLDTLRPDRLDLYGYARDTAPNLRALGEESAVFTTVAAQSSQTLTSHKSLFTGKYPATLMLEQTGADLLTLAQIEAPRDYLVDVFSSVRGTLAAGFLERGYRTGAFTDGAWMSRETGFDPGFEVFDASGGGLEAILPRALSWLDSLRDDPAFLFLHTYDIHCPYPCREPFNSLFCTDHSQHIPLEDSCGKGDLYGRELSPADLRAISDHYDGGIRSADDHLGLFFEELRARGLYDRALIAVTSDHGESLGERGPIGHGGLHLEELFVPLILKFPASWGLSSTRIGEPAELVDLLPTLFALSGANAPHDLDGRSLLPILLRGVRGKDYLVAQTTFEEAPEFSSNPTKRSLLKPGRWQIIQDARNSSAEFFSLERDPHGLVRVEIRGPEFPPFLDILLEKGRSAARPALRTSEPAHFSAELERELAELGYAGR